MLKKIGYYIKYPCSKFYQFFSHVIGEIFFCIDDDMLLHLLEGLSLKCCIIVDQWENYSFLLINQENILRGRKTHTLHE